MHGRWLASTGRCNGKLTKTAKVSKALCGFGACAVARLQGGGATCRPGGRRERERESVPVCRPAGRPRRGHENVVWNTAHVPIMDPARREGIHELNRDLI